jgi:hypothetical protein
MSRFFAVPVAVDVGDMRIARRTGGDGDGTDIDWPQ